MTPSNLIRLGGLAAMVVGVLYASQTYVLWPLIRALARTGGMEGSSGAFYVIMVIASLVVLLALGVMAIVVLDAQKGRPYRLVATLASLTVAGGVALVLAGMSGPLYTFSVTLSALVLILGAVIVTVGLVALGIATIAAGALPWWCGGPHRQSHVRAVGAHRGSTFGAGRLCHLPSGHTADPARFKGALR